MGVRGGLCKSDARRERDFHAEVLFGELLEAVRVVGGEVFSGAALAEF